MKVHILNHSDSAGGAARAAYRIHHALRRAGVDSTLLVSEALTGDWTVKGPAGQQERLKGKLRPRIGALANRFMRSGNPILHSPALLPSAWPRRLNTSDADIAHLIWVNNEMLSVEDVGRIKKPVVWTLQDMWAICGAEHVTDDHRFAAGYLKGNRPGHESGLDLNRLTWLRKRRAWRQPLDIVAPSRWMADNVRRSALMQDWPVTVIANPIDTDSWMPVDKRLARSIMGLPQDVPLLLFGTSGANAAPHKGFDLLQSALALLRGSKDLQLVIFGEMAPKSPPNLGIPAHYTGHLHDDVSMRVLFSAADAVAIPSRIDNLPNVAIEAIACATPVVAFETCGLPDIVQHQQTGYLAKAFDPEDLAQGIRWLLGDLHRHAQMCRNARDDAVARFSYPVIAQQYKALYERVLVRT